MFGIGPVWIAVAVVIALFLEIVLFWASTALADVPPMGWGKILLVVVLVTAASAALAGGLLVADDRVGLSGSPGSLTGVSRAPFAPENRQPAVMAGLLAVAVSWAVPVVLYPMLLPVSVPRGAWVSVLQVLLRAFLYVLIVALVMVALALWQILAGSEVHAGLVEAPRLALALARP